jgi:predicted Rdx family selenoprotein
VAALIKDALGADAEVVPGGRGEFTVWVDDKKVAEKTRSGFPAENVLVETVRKALE